MSKDDIEVRKGIQGLSKRQMVEYFNRRDRIRRSKDDTMAALLPDMEDENAELMSEIHPLGLIATIHQTWMIDVYDPHREDNLLVCWHRREVRGFMSLKRQRVWEYMAVKNAVSVAEEANKDK